jgi:hypothetical protein
MYEALALAMKSSNQELDADLDTAQDEAHTVRF